MYILPASLFPVYQMNNKRWCLCIVCWEMSSITVLEDHIFWLMYSYNWSPFLSHSNISSWPICKLEPTSFFFYEGIVRNPPIRSQMWAERKGQCKNRYRGICYQFMIFSSIWWACLTLIPNCHIDYLIDLYCNWHKFNRYVNANG